MKEEFRLRLDGRSQLEMELILPLLSVVSIAVVVLNAIAADVPGQFAGRGFHLPAWASFIALFVLVAVGVLTVQKPRMYEITDDGLDVILRFQKYHVPFEEIKEVVAMGERTAPSLAEALGPDTFSRLADGMQLLLMLVQGKTLLPLPTVPPNVATSASGGAKVVLKDGRSAVLSPAELSPFLNAMERQFRRRNLDAVIVRAVPVQLG